MTASAPTVLLAFLASLSAGAGAEASSGTDSDEDDVADSSDTYPNDPRYAEPLTVTIECNEMNGPLASPEDLEALWTEQFVIDRVLLDFTEPWTTQFPPDVYCDVAALNGVAAYYLEEPVTDIEQAEWDATEPEYRQYTLGTAYSQCVEHGTTWTTQEWPLSPGQATEALEALTFCPDHPDRASIEERIAAQGVQQSERDQGIRFGSGHYRVGVDIQPGSLFTESDDGFESCYWERQDSTGEVIDNFFGQVFRAEVTIAPTDYAFLTEGCGEWQSLE